MVYVWVDFEGMFVNYIHISYILNTGPCSVTLLAEIKAYSFLNICIHNSLICCLMFVSKGRFQIGSAASFSITAENSKWFYCCTNKTTHTFYTAHKTHRPNCKHNNQCSHRCTYIRTYIKSTHFLTNETRHGSTKEAGKFCAWS